MTDSAPVWLVVILVYLTMLTAWWVDHHLELRITALEKSAETQKSK